MYWWKRKPGEREQWTLDPLTAVGPLRFGMAPEQVEAALDGVPAGISQGRDPGRPFWQRYTELGISTIYDSGARLVAVAIEALNGPLVRLGDVELIARTPSEVRSDLLALGASVRVNWSGDSEVEAWGLSMGAQQEHAVDADGLSGRQDTMITNALFVCAELADDPYRSEPILNWWDVRDLEPNPGAWPVKPDQDRPRWDWTPLRQVGPLRFGMSAVQVSAALDGEEPAARRGHFPWPVFEEHGVWSLTEERFDRAGIVAHYWSGDRVPRLAAVTVQGRKGPQISYTGRALIGHSVKALDSLLCEQAANDEIQLIVGCGGELGPDGLNMYVRAARAGDAVVSEARFGADGWDDHG